MFFEKYTASLVVVTGTRTRESGVSAETTTLLVSMSRPSSEGGSFVQEFTHTLLNISADNAGRESDILFGPTTARPTF